MPNTLQSPIYVVKHLPVETPKTFVPKEEEEKQDTKKNIEPNFDKAMLLSRDVDYFQSLKKVNAHLSPQEIIDKYNLSMHSPSMNPKALEQADYVLIRHGFSNFNYNELVSRTEYGA